MEDTRIMIVDDHPVMLIGIRHLLEDVEHCQVVGDALDYETFKRLAENTPYDLLILDINLNGQNGLDILKEIKAETPEKKVLIYSLHDDCHTIERAFREGCDGYVCKKNVDLELPQAVELLIAGEQYLPPDLGQQIALSKLKHNKTLRHEDLPEQQRKVFWALVNGKRPIDIQAQMEISKSTYRTHRNRMFEKMQMNTVEELRLYAKVHNLI